MSAGILTNERLQDSTSVMKECVKSFDILERYYLPHTLVSPMDLKAILNTLITQLSR